MTARRASLTLLCVVASPLWAWPAGGVSDNRTITLDVAVTDKSGNPESISRELSREPAPGIMRSQNRRIGLKWVPYRLCCKRNG